MKKYIYICSAGHSGSTLLDLLIGSHSKIESLGEINQLPKNISLNTTCMCGNPVRSCALWEELLTILGQKLKTNLFKNPYVLDLGFINAQDVVDRRHQTNIYNIKRKLTRGFQYLYYSLGLKKHLNNSVSTVKSINSTFDLYNCVLSILDVDGVVDSSKDYLKAIRLYMANPQRVKLILLVRDGRGVFYSNLKRGTSRKDSLMPWLNHYKRALRLINRYVPEKDLLVVKYENIAMNTEQELIKICDFIDMKYESEMIDFMSHSHHIANGNNMRFASGSHIRVDLGWREKLTAQDLAYFRRNAGKMNAVLGYSE
jgi:hypothetical protein